MDMKRIMLGLIGVLFVVGLKLSPVPNNDVDTLTLQNVEALATPEASISIGPFCIVTSGICFTDQTGFFMRGTPQIWK